MVTDSGVHRPSAKRLGHIQTLFPAVLRVSREGGEERGKKRGTHSVTWWSLAAAREFISTSAWSFVSLAGVLC